MPGITVTAPLPPGKTGRKIGGKGDHRYLAAIVLGSTAVYRASFSWVGERDYGNGIPFVLSGPNRPFISISVGRMIDLLTHSDLAKDRFPIFYSDSSQEVHIAVHRKSGELQPF